MELYKFNDFLNSCGEYLNFLSFHSFGKEFYEFQYFRNFCKKKTFHDVHDSGMELCEFRVFCCDLDVNT